MKRFPLFLASLLLTLPAAAANPKADPQAVVTTQHARFTILTPQLIRMEWSEDGVFEDRATLSFVNRKLPVPAFKVRDTRSKLVIKTDSLTLTYTKDGKFSPELYQQFLLGQGKSDQQFVAEIQRDLSKEALVAGVAGTYPIPKAIVQQMHDILTEARFVRTMTFRATDHLDEVSVSDEEAKAYYDAHQKEFLSTEHIKAQYVVLSPENFRNVKINPEEIRNYYEQNLNRWTAPEERRASHILIDFGSDKAAALKKAEAVLAEVKADPKRFAELAKQESADTGSAEQGGDLDFFGRGIMTKPFEDAVFAAKKGDIVGPVETEFGYHVIYVTDVAPSKPMPFDEVKAQIEREYVEQMSIREFSEHADEFTNIVYEQSESLEPAAEKFGLKIETVDNVTREGVKDPALARIINEHVVESLYGAECLKEKRNSSAIEASANVLVAARVLEYHPTEELAFETVKSRIVQKLRLEKASEDHRFYGIADFYILESRFMLEEYERVKLDGPAILEKVSDDKKARTARLISEANLVLGDAADAKKYLDESNRSLSPKSYSDFFYAGSVLFAVRDYQGAIDNYSMMRDRSDSLGQIANYNMGYSYIKTRNKVAAMAAFKDASMSDFDPKIKEDAYFNYAKLAFDLNNDSSVQDIQLHSIGSPLQQGLRRGGGGLRQYR